VAVNGQTRTVSSGLIYNQISTWLDFMTGVIGAEDREAFIASAVMQQIKEEQAPSQQTHAGREVKKE
jgi:hypothetical protein